MEYTKRDIIAIELLRRFYGFFIPKYAIKAAGGRFYVRQCMQEKEGIL